MHIFFQGFFARSQFSYLYGKYEATLSRQLALLDIKSGNSKVGSVQQMVFHLVHNN